MNVDAIFNKEGMLIGVGAITRDTNNDAMVSLSMKLQRNFSPLYAETEALLSSLEWTADIHVLLHQMKSDAFQLIQALNSNKMFVNEFGRRLDDIYSLSSFLLEVIFRHGIREANKAAHDHAKYTTGSEEDFVWLEDILSPIASVILSD